MFSRLCTTSLRTIRTTGTASRASRSAHSAAQRTSGATAPLVLAVGTAGAAFVYYQAHAHTEGSVAGYLQSIAKRLDALETALGLAAPHPSHPVPTDYIGKDVAELDTPALILDLDGMENNIGVMAAFMKKHGGLWRPHTKSIRCPEIAHKYIEAGACGLTCAKVSQAKAMVDGGIKDVLIANQVVGATKITAVAELATRATVCVACDDADNMKQLSEIATAKGVTLHVVVDMNIGMHRCGVPWTDDKTIVGLCKLATELPGISWRGLMGYDGHAQGGDAESQAETKRVSERVLSAKTAVEAAGLKVGLVTGAGSGNFIQARGLGAITEIQGGGGVLYCQIYETAFGNAGNTDFKSCMKIMAQVVSVAQQGTTGRVCADAGFKTTFDSFGMLPKVLSHPKIKVDSLNAEHTILDVPDGAPPLQLGERIMLQPVYSDSTLFLHRVAYGVRNGKVETVFDMSASVGRVQ